MRTIRTYGKVWTLVMRYKRQCYLAKRANYFRERNLRFADDLALLKET